MTNLKAPPHSRQSTRVASQPDAANASGGRRTLLAIAHPGHELFVHGWVEQVRPLVAVLTDGSGRDRSSRLEFTSRILDDAGATATPLYGVVPDRRVYEAVRRRDEGFVLAASRLLESLLVEAQVEQVVGDAAERAIMAHDVWRAVVDAAVARAARRLGRPIQNFEFPIERNPAQASHSLDDHDVRLRLDDDALARKLAAARSYLPLRADIDALCDERRESAFRLEVLRPARAAWDEFERDELPAFEAHGRRLAAAGVYPEAIEFQRHVRPLLLRLRDWSEAA